MHLVYFDETGTDGHSSVAMFGALVVPTGTFGAASVMHHNAIRQILPADNLDVFRNFMHQRSITARNLLRELMNQSDSWRY